MFYPEAMTRLIEELARLPGIGPKSAQRLAFFLLDSPAERIDALVGALRDARERIRYCSVCWSLTDTDPCRICQNPARDRSTLCVVEHPRDVIAMERTREYRGLYHVLHGALDPMEGVGPDDIRLKELVRRVGGGDVREVIVCTNPTTEGEATAVYIARVLRPFGVRVTRIARGLPVGGDIEYADEVTLAKALEGRREM
ncbi:recombination protein RecR [Caldinitratiruptor microaerophilus]|uniref:Recombination protein RecR n=2 Tax=Caldinitratiruptor microaerophilus TaxID=671077 RepID=A0AA35CNU9_9FIRM|nr:recombination protein RecR [Caldinitratiruptor microaerophilus]